MALAGALAELAHSTLKDDFANIDPRQAKIFLLDGADRVLPTYPPELSTKAETALANLGATVRRQALVDEIGADQVIVRPNGQTRTIQSRTVLWAAG